MKISSNGRLLSLLLQQVWGLIYNHLFGSQDCIHPFGFWPRRRRLRQLPSSSSSSSSSSPPPEPFRDHHDFSDDHQRRKISPLTLGFLKRLWPSRAFSPMRPSHPSIKKPRGEGSEQLSREIISVLRPTGIWGTFDSRNPLLPKQEFGASRSVQWSRRSQ